MDKKHNNTSKKRYGNNLREYRTRAYMSQQALADAAGVVKSTIYTTERGTIPRLDVMQKLARALKMPVEKLFPILEPQPEEPDQEQTPQPGAA